MESEYSQLDHQNGAKPEVTVMATANNYLESLCFPQIIDNYDYCTVPKTKTKEKKEKQEQVFTVI